MLLRRLKAHVEKENWFAVGIDFAIVVIGVFIGIQVANWNESRADRADEVMFLERLQEDLMRVEEASARVRTRRISIIDDLNDAAAIVFNKESAKQLTPEQCTAIGSSSYYYLNVLELPSLTELANSGRVEIIRDRELRTALVEYQQRVEALKYFTQTQTAVITNIATFRPELVKLETYFDETLSEIYGKYSCDVSGMRADQAFLNVMSENIDSYDAYLRGGLLPWSEKLIEVQRLVDIALER
jgi:hypothetical protein